MPWQEASIMEQRFEFVTLASRPDANVAALCRGFGISRETGHKWIRRFKAGGKGALADHPRRPHASPERTGDILEAFVLALRDQHPAWGARKLRTRLATLGQTQVPAASTITEILRRHGRISGAASAAHKPVQRFEREHPNELWQMDFKGYVPMHVGGRCHPLTVLDDHSRFVVGLWACVDEQSVTVHDRLEAIFRRYGLPQRILTDNGPPWGVGSAPARYTRLTVWLLRLGVGVSHGRPRHPQTQGKDERFHRTLKAELLSRQNLASITHAQRLFDAWRDVYNLERPSEAIGMLVPAARYRPSERAYPEKLPEVVHSPGDTVRRVRHDGSLNYRGSVWYVGQAFKREHLGLRTLDDGTVEARYGPYVVARFPPSDTPINASRLAPVLRSGSLRSPPLRPWARRSKCQ